MSGLDATMTDQAMTNGSLANRYLPAEGASRIAALIALALLGTLMLWASAKIKVPFYPVEMTMQGFVIFLIAATYGMRLGLATILLYLAEGLMGLPVFTGTPEKGIGLAYMIGPTGGYLAGWIATVAFVGWFADRGVTAKPIALFLVMLAGAVIYFTTGVAWLGVLFGWDKPILAWGLYPFILGDLTKIALAVAAVTATSRLVGRGKPLSH